MQIRVKFNTPLGKDVDVFCHGLVARIFLHEVDHLYGQNMWEVPNPEACITPRKLIKVLPLTEL